MIRRLVAEMTDGRRLVVSVEPAGPMIVDTTAEPVDEESGIRQALAKCAPEPRFSHRASMRGRLRRVA